MGQDRGDAEQDLRDHWPDTARDGADDTYEARRHNRPPDPRHPAHLNPALYPEHGRYAGTAEYNLLPPRPRMPTPQAPAWLPALVLAVGMFAAVAVTFDRPGLGLVAAGVVGGLAAFVALLVRPGVPEGGRAPDTADAEGSEPSDESPGSPAPSDDPPTDDRSRPWAAVYGVASALLLSTALFLDAGWVLLWTLPASFLLASLAFATRNPAARQNTAGLFSGAIAVVRNMGAAPRFLARPLQRVSSRTNTVPVLATVGITATLLVAFGTLLILADPVFREFAVRPFRSVTVDGGSVGSVVSALVAMAATTGAVLAARRRLPGPRPGCVVRVGRCPAAHRGPRFRALVRTGP